ncbi:MAG: XRE family transcriptional regulator [Actinomyces bowdenii]|nr:XRE family transcriptional regulator [Actinomyces bowdenii]
MDTSASAIGRRLRAARCSYGLTLEAVSAETGISASTLSRLESGRRRACLDLITPLARLYGLSLDELVDGGPPHRAPRPIHRRESVVLPLTLAAEGQRSSKMLLPASRCVPRLRTHQGSEWLCVLSGRLRLVVGDDDLLLHSGESAEFDTSTPHWFGTVGEGPVEILSMPGRRGHHLRLGPRP